jgi:hypothetical protein
VGDFLIISYDFNSSNLPEAVKKCTYPTGYGYKHKEIYPYLGSSEDKELLKKIRTSI